ncbi:glycosyltransferase [Polaribacter cellanae]|uniref:Glycosyltransferase n=1 Tax=Polaribacter cellanae TaxID=2818493 RepID=A0A975H728_9FLAO|nr:glycosyltransferase [Polaribacter cellanae]QTE23042.1 glycosyltransferase [Polaribacter cellanae]
MIKDKILVYSDYIIHENSGGPPGYLYKCVLDNHPKEIVLLDDALKINKIKFKVKLRHKLFKLLGFFSKKLTNKNTSKFIYSNSLNYKFIYFHDVFTLYNVLHLIKKEQIIILQSHSPQLPSEEKFDFSKNQKELIHSKLIEKLAFERANVLVFPNKECVITYKSLILKKHTIKYLLTGIKKIESSVFYPIKKNKINLLYIGRRNDIKGFNFLIKTFKEVTATRDDLCLFIAGSGALINGKNIYDLGLITTPYNWINSVDFVFSLNEKSYFDLNVIETICLGTPLIMTTTEGHNFFKNTRGIIDVTNKNLVDVLLSKNLINKKYKIENKKAILSLYNHFFTESIFKENLQTICREIIQQFN